MRKTLSIHKYLFLLLIILQSNSYAQGTLFQAPELYCVKNQGSDVQLFWNLPTISACFATYEIYYSIDNKNGAYTLLTTINNPNQNNTTVNNPSSNKTTYFYIVQRGTCINNNTNTIIFSDTLDNATSFPAIELKSVSVVNEVIELKWIPNTYKEVIGYLIFSNKPGNFFNTPIDTVFGNTSDTYIDNNVNVSNTQYTYKIRTLMSCDGDGAITTDAKDHESSVLTISQTNACNKTASVSWLYYKYENTNVVNYEIQTRTTNTNFATIATQSNLATSFIIQNVPPQDSVFVRLKINLPNGSFAFSNVRSFFSEVPIPIENDYIRNITIKKDNSVDIEYIKDTIASPIKTPIFLQATTTINTFQNAGIFTLIEDNTKLLYNDKSTNPSLTSYFYRIEYRDTCQNKLFSDTVQTLHLDVTEEIGNKAKINWSGFHIPTIQFENYQIYKTTIDEDTTEQIIATIADRNTNTFTDEQFFDTKNTKLKKVCYHIVANYYHLSDAIPRAVLQSASNVVCKIPTPKALVPNAFAPQGYNQTIKPFLLFASEENYEFIVFNRWNQVVFKTNNTQESWNGMYKGDFAPFDSYTYIVIFKDNENNNTYKEKGTFLLLR